MNKKGFTLIELLAVIVILAIIALIATPIILNMINSAKKSSARSAALGYIDAIEYNNGFAEIEQPGYTSVIGNDLNVSDISIKVKGKKPSSGTVTVNSKGKVESAKDLCFNGYRVDYDGKDAKVKGKCGESGNNGGSGSGSGEEIYNVEKPEFNGTKEEPKAATSTTPADTHKGILYLDPTDLSKSCSASSSSSAHGTHTGCMKFYIYKDENNYYTMIVDHNTASSYVAWNNYLASLRQSTENWVGKTRLIGADEVAHIVGADTSLGWSKTKMFNDNPTDLDSQVSWFYLDGTGNTYSTTDGWHTQNANSTSKSKYAWLYDNTANCSVYGCNVERSNYPKAYWTQDYTVFSYDNRAWCVHSQGTLTITYRTVTDVAGIRPVLTLPKCIFDSTSKCVGWLLLDKTNQKWAYYNQDGSRKQSGWGLQIEDLSGVKQDYYFESGYPVKGLKTIDNKKYYFEETDTDGNNFIDYNMVRNKDVTINNNTYHFGSDGVCTNC